MSLPRRLAAANPPDILPRPDLAHGIPWYWQRGYGVPMMELHPQTIASYLGDMRRARTFWKMARMVRDHTDADIRAFYYWWAGEAESAYRSARQTRDFGGYGHTCYEE